MTGPSQTLSPLPHLPCTLRNADHAVPLALQDSVEVLKESIGALEGEGDLGDENRIHKTWIRIMMIISVNVCV